MERGKLGKESVPATHIEFLDVFLDRIHDNDHQRKETDLYNISEEDIEFIDMGVERRRESGYEF